MHVVHVVCSGAFAGVERYIASVAPLLARRGIDVSVVGGDPAQMGGTLGASVRFLPADSVRDALRAIRRLPRADVLNTHMSNADLVGLIHTAGVRRPRLVSTRHFAAPRGGDVLRRRAFAAAEPRFDAQVSISEFVARSIGSPSTVVHTGVADVAPASTSGGPPFLLVAQRLETEKDTATAVRAWAASGAARAGWRLRIAGEGSEAGALGELARREGVADTVEFLGFREDVGALMSEASLFLAPTPREGLGLSVLEAMARGTAVVASAAGGHLESVGRVHGATLFPPGDAGAAALRIDELTADPVARRAYGERLRERQRAHFGFERQVAGLIDVYEEVLSR